MEKEYQLSIAQPQHYGATLAKASTIAAAGLLASCAGTEESESTATESTQYALPAPQQSFLNNNPNFPARLFTHVMNNGEYTAEGTNHSWALSEIPLGSGYNAEIRAIYNGSNFALSISVNGEVNGDPCSYIYRDNQLDGIVDQAQRDLNGNKEDILNAQHEYRRELHALP